MIQAKRYGPGTAVGSPEIQQYASLAHQEAHVDKVLVLTTNGFSRQALELADDLHVKTIDGDTLVHIIREEGALDLLAEYVPPLSVDASDPSSAPEFHSQGGEARVRERLSATRKWVIRFSVLWVAGFATAMVAPGDVLTGLAALLVLVAWIGCRSRSLAVDGRSSATRSGRPGSSSMRSERWSQLGRRSPAGCIYSADGKGQQNRRLIGY